MMIKNNSLTLVFFCAALLFTSVNAKASTTNALIAPDVLLKSSTYKIIEALKQAKKERKTKPEFIHSLVTEHIAPQLDFIAASRWVLGKYWADIDRSQKIRFIKSFRKLLIQFYSVALAEYVSSNNIDHDIIQFKALRKETEKDKDTTVYSIVSPPNTNKKVSVNYHMHQTRKGWKIYDVSVEGISMIGTYKSSFEPQLRNIGVEALIASLEERNNKLAIKKVNFKEQ